MWSCLSQRESVLLGLLYVISLLVVSSTPVDSRRGWTSRVRRGVAAQPTSKDRSRAGPKATAEVGSESCRCAADQWEGALRSVDREIYLGGQTDSDGQRLHAAELETNTVIHYDYRNGLFASVDTDSSVKTVIDYNTVFQS